MKSKKFAFIMIGLLWLQFLLGMLANLFQEIPKDKPDEVFHKFGFIMFHALLGWILLILAIVFLVKTIRAGTDKRPAIGGLANILAAFIFGETFVATQKDIFSLLMALAFLGALMSYARITFSSEPKQSK